MRTISIKNIILVIGVSGLLLSCSSSRHFSREDLKTKGLYATTGLYGDSITSDSLNIADSPWQELFTDTCLKSMIKEGLSNNTDLLIAVQKVKEAEAALSQSKAAIFPSLSGQAQGNYTRYSKALYPTYDTFGHGESLELTSSWELDIWGKLRGAKRAAYASYLASDAGKKAVQTRLISDIATTYYTLIGLDKQLAITRQTVKNNIDLVKTMKALQQSGQVTGAAIVQSEAARYAAEVTIPDIKQQIKETENTLSILLGKNPGPIQRGSLDTQKADTLLETGVPSQLLNNRPDVQQAEYNVISAYETTKSARKYFYPSLTITASGGFESINLDDLLKPENLAINLLGGLTQPIFAQKANSTRLKVAKAKQEEALLTFKNTILTAGSEVQNALSSFQKAQQKAQLRSKQLDALKKSVDYTKQLLIYGSADYTEVLDAQQNYLAAQLNDVNDRLQQLTAVVSLYQALGGGWK